MVNWAKIPSDKQDWSVEELRSWLEGLLESRRHYHPGKEYNLLIQVQHSKFTRMRVARNYPEFIDDPGGGMNRRDSHWKRYSEYGGDPSAVIRIPSRHTHEFISDEEPVLEEMKDKKDFMAWFEGRFPNLPDGVYTAIQQGGRKGYHHLFMLRYRNGEVEKWQKKSRGHQYENSSSYYTFPLYFMLRSRYDI